MMITLCHSGWTHQSILVALFFKPLCMYHTHNFQIHFKNHILDKTTPQECKCSVRCSYLSITYTTLPIKKHSARAHPKSNTNSPTMYKSPPLSFGQWPYTQRMVFQYYSFCLFDFRVCPVLQVYACNYCRMFVTHITTDMGYLNNVK